MSSFDSDDFTTPNSRYYDQLRAEKRVAVRQEILKKELAAMPGASDIRRFGSMIHNYAMLWGPEQQEVVTYHDFLKVKEATTGLMKTWCTAELFSFDKSISDSICDVGTLLQVMDSRITMTKYFLLMSQFDYNCDGMLEPYEFYEFYAKHIVALEPRLTEIKRKLEEEESKVMKTIVITKMNLFLDQARTGKYAIKDILASGVVQELDCLCNGSSRYDFTNWFCAENIEYILEEYNALAARSMDGLIRKENFVEFQPKVKNRIFLRRIYDYLSSAEANYAGIMDITLFCRFLLIMRTKSHPVCLRTIFYALDADDDGLISFSDLRLHFDELCELSRDRDPDATVPEASNFEPWANEIFDMVFADAKKGVIDLETWLRGPYVHFAALKLINSITFSDHETIEDRNLLITMDYDLEVLAVEDDEFETAPQSLSL